MADRIADFLAEKTARRGLALLLFLAVIVAFRSLAVVLVFFVAFERALFFSAGFLSRRFGWKRLNAFLLVLGVLVLGLALTGVLSASSVKRLALELRDQLPQRVAALREWAADRTVPAN